jgi:hypothetical protein
MGIVGIMGAALRWVLAAAWASSNRSSGLGGLGGSGGGSPKLAFLLDVEMNGRFLLGDILLLLVMLLLRVPFPVGDTNLPLDGDTGRFAYNFDICRRSMWDRVPILMHGEEHLP